MSQEHLASLLSCKQCEIILNKLNHETNNNLKFKNHTIISAIEVTGFLGEYFHLVIECIKQEHKTEAGHEQFSVHDDGEDDAILLKFFIKKQPPVDNQHEKVTIFRKESYLYDSLLPKLQKYSSEPWCPKIYLCHTNILVLEDLNCQDFYSLSSRDILRQDEMFPVLNGLAAMHASSLLYEFHTKENIQNIYSECLEEITVHPDVAWFTTGLKAIIKIAEQHAKYQTEVAQEFISSELPLHLGNVYFMVNPSTRYRNVLCHRDTWGGNIFLHRTDSLKSAMFVDFQTCRYCPAAIDVIFTLFMNLTKQERLDTQSKYIKYYYERLLGHIRNHISSDVVLTDVVFSESELLQSIDEFMLFGYVYRALAISVLRVPKEFITDCYKNVERSEKLLQYMKQNAEFCDIMNDSVEDIVAAIADISIKQVV